MPERIRPLRLALPALVCAALALAVAAAHAARPVPALTGRVVDQARLLSPATAAKLERDLAALEASDSTQVAVLTVPSLDGDSLEEFSIKVVEAWKLGRDRKDNGALLLVAHKERKVRIEVGRGLEGKLTDLVSGRIIRGDIVPRFKQGDFDGGIAAGVGAIVGTVRGEYRWVGGERRGGRGGHREGLGTYVVIFVVFLLLARMGLILGTVAGGVALPVVAAMLFPAITYNGQVALGVVGLILGLITAAVMRLVGALGGRAGFFLGPGGFLGGGGGGGGGFSGGGGSFGGGGASGDW